MKACKNCHKLSDDTAKFCQHCGSALLSESKDEARNYPPGKHKGFFKDKKKMLAICGAALVAVVVIIAVLVLSAENSVKLFIESLDAADSETAAQVYSDRIAGNSKRMEQTREETAEYVLMILQQFKNQELSYDHVISRLHAVDSTGITGNEAHEAISEVEELHYYRETFSAAERYFEKGDYAAAINNYSLIADADFENGSTAVERLAQSKELYRNGVLAEVENCMGTNSYTTAFMLLDDALYVLPGDIQLISAREECVSAEYDYRIQLLIDEASVYANNRDFASAIQCIDGHIEAYPDEVKLQQTKELFYQQFESYVVEESMRLALAGEYEKAASLANSGLSYFSSSEVTELLHKYKSYIPVLLGDMEMFQNNTRGGGFGGSGKSDEVDVYLEDNYGNKYDHSFSVSKGSVTYLVNYAYSTFSGTVAFPKGRESDDARESATLTVYGDDKEIAVFRDFDEASRPEQFSIDISGYEKITLAWECTGYNIWSDWGEFATIFDGVLMPISITL